MNRLSCRLAAAAVLALVVSLVGCGNVSTSGPKASSPKASGATAGSHTTASPATNGLENQTAATVVQEASAAFRAAKSVHVRGTIPIEGRMENFDLRYQGSSSSGTLTFHGVRVQIRTIGRALYMKTDERGWAAMGNSSAGQSMMANRWVKVSSAQSPTPVSLASFAAELTAQEYAQGGKVGQATLAGQKVVVVIYPDGSKLYVANAGTADPLRFDKAGSTGGRRDFTEYGAPVDITAPPNAMNLS